MANKFAYALKSLVEERFDAKQLYEELMRLKPTVFTVADYMTICWNLDARNQDTRTRFLEIMGNKQADPSILPTLALAAIHTPGMAELGNVIVKDTLFVCSQNPDDEFAGKVHQHLVNYEFAESQNEASQNNVPESDSETNSYENQEIPPAPDAGGVVIQKAGVVITGNQGGTTFNDGTTVYQDKVELEKE